MPRVATRRTRSAQGFNDATDLGTNAHTGVGSAAPVPPDTDDAVSCSTGAASEPGTGGDRPESLLASFVSTTAAAASFAPAAGLRRSIDKQVITHDNGDSPPMPLSETSLASVHRCASTSGDEDEEFELLKPLFVRHLRRLSSDLGFVLAGRHPHGAAPDARVPGTPAMPNTTSEHPYSALQQVQGAAPGNAPHPLAGQMPPVQLPSLSAQLARPPLQPMGAMMNQAAVHSMGNPMGTGMNQAMVNPMGMQMGSQMGALMNPAMANPMGTQMVNPMSTGMNQAMVNPMGTGMNHAMGNPMGTQMVNPMGTGMNQAMVNSMGNQMGTGMNQAMGSLVGNPMGAQMGNQMGLGMNPAMGNQMGTQMVNSMGTQMGNSMANPVGPAIGNLMSSNMGGYVPHPAQHHMAQAAGNPMARPMAAMATVRPTVHSAAGNGAAGRPLQLVMVPNAAPTGTSKRFRTLLSPSQSRALQEVLKRTAFPDRATREELAARLGITARSVQVWFQNQRQKERVRVASLRSDGREKAHAPAHSGAQYYGAHRPGEMPQFAASTAFDAAQRSSAPASPLCSPGLAAVAAHHRRRTNSLPHIFENTSSLTPGSSSVPDAHASSDGESEASADSQAEDANSQLGHLLAAIGCESDE